MYKIYNMKLGDVIALYEIEMRITRVPGGWIFQSTKGQTFVPYNNEFQ